MSDNQIIPQQQNDKLTDYIRRPDVIAKFRDVLGSDMEAMQYVQSVLIAVSTSETGLQECTPASIVRAALRAATLELSCDPAKREAWLVPYNNKVKVKNPDGTTREEYRKEANFQPHYHGLYNLAMRTGLYQVINVSPIYEGTEIVQDVYTGMHYIGALVGDKQFGFMPEQVTRLRRVDGNKGRVIGWLGYMKPYRGGEKTAYMTVEEIHEHARKYNDKGYQYGKAWKNDKDTMEMKTVLRKILKEADLSGSKAAKLRAALEDNQPGEEVEIEAEIMTPEEIEAASEQAQPVKSDPESILSS